MMLYKKVILFTQSTGMELLLQHRILNPWKLPGPCHEKIILKML